jgi:oxaloacetate decarboxylase gamma subunit
MYFMNQELIDAFILLLIGMITVFTVLALVVATGRGLIWAVNRITKDVPSVKKTAHSTLQVERNITPQKMAAIVAAVNIVTKGKGKVTNIVTGD